MPPVGAPGTNLGFQKVVLLYLPKSGCGFLNSKGYIFKTIIYYIFLTSRDAQLCLDKKKYIELYQSQLQ